jgi:hypothetical protein
MGKIVHEDYRRLAGAGLLDSTTNYEGGHEFTAEGGRLVAEVPGNRASILVKEAEDPFKRASWQSKDYRLHASRGR